MSRIILMQAGGVRVDEDGARQAAEKLTPVIDEMQNKLNQLAGFSVNVNSSPNIRRIFNPEKTTYGWAVNGALLESTPAGAPSLGKQSLILIDNEASRLILDIRSAIKTRDTFLMGHIVGHAVDGRVYPSINQVKGERGGTGTGRLSYVDPALQQIPSRNKRVAEIVKSVFYPDESQVWLDADKSSFEVRIFAHLLGLVGEMGVIKAYKDDPRTDFHQYVADLTNLVRNATYSGQPNAKQLNLSAIFNSGNGTIARQMGMDWEWAEFVNDDGELIRYRKAGTAAMNIINEYHSRLPGVKKLATMCKDAMCKRGFIFTFKGRRIRIPQARKYYKASGLLIQATAAEYNKESIIIMDDTLRQFGGRLLLNTHDSYSMSIPKEALQDAWLAVKKKIENPTRANVPLLLDQSGYGPTWWEALTGNNKVNNNEA